MIWIVEELRLAGKFPYFILQIGPDPTSCIASFDGYHPVAHALGP